MWDPQHLTTLEASYGDSFYFFDMTSQTYRQLVAGPNVFPVRYEQTYRVLNERQDDGKCPELW
jgi:hypothetical protein